MKEMRCLHCYSNEFSERNGHLYCLYCGSKYRQRPEDQEILLSMAYRELRFMNFLDAENAFEDIISRHPDLPEAYWGCVCARYGIKFEQDYTGRQIPTCCLPAIESILEDHHYQKALELSDEETAEWYRGQGEYLERVRKTWIERARKLAPYDVFISYKDSDQEKGLDRTEDSLKAQSIYTHLLTQGYSVFYSRESLSNVIGEKYEPYIFQALSTSRAMIVYGSTPEYINSTWVRNEWQRYAKKMQKGEKDKGSLIVICDGFSPKDLPPMLRSMQVLDGRDMFCYSKLDDHLKGLLAKKVSPEEEARRKLLEDAILKKLLEEQAAEEAKKKAEEEAKKKAEEEIRLRAEAEARRKAEEEARKRAEAEAKRRAEAEAKRKAEEEARRRAKAEAKSKRKAEKTATKKQIAENRREKSNARPIRNWVVSIIAVLIFVIGVPVAVAIVWDYIQTEKIENELGFVSNGDGTCYVANIGKCKDSEVIIPLTSPDGDRVTSIGSGAFYNCTSLVTIEIPESVEIIEDHAFRGCTGLISIDIPSNVKIIYENTFQYCENLLEVTISSNVTEIEIHAFQGCSSLQKIYFQGTMEEWQEILKAVDWDQTTGEYRVLCTDGDIDKTEETEISASEGLGFISNGDGTCTLIGIGNCKDTKIVIPEESPKGDKVTSIGASAFYCCSSLTSIAIPDGVASIDDSAFEGCTSLTSITIPTNVTSIGSLTFKGCSNLTNISIPNSVTSIGEWAFSGCSNLTNISIPNSVTNIGKYTFYGCSSLTSITIPDGVTGIGDSAFENCSSLTNVEIPDGVKTLGYGAFAACRALKSITIPDGVKSIGSYAFSGCSSLESIIIPNSMIKFDEGALKSCGGLTSITFQGTKAEWKDIEKGLWWNLNTGSYTVHCTDGDIPKSES